MRLDRALSADLGSALRSPPILLFVVLQAVAAVAFIDRRGTETLATVVLVWVGMLILAFFAWWAGRHRLAHPEPDEVPAAAPRAAFALIAAGGMAVWGFGISVPVGFVLFASGFGAWIWVALRSGGMRGAWLACFATLVPSYRCSS